MARKIAEETKNLRKLVAVQQENYEALELRKNKVIETLQEHIGTLERLTDAYRKTALKPHSCVMPRGRGQG